MIQSRILLTSLWVSSIGVAAWVGHHFAAPQGSAVPATATAPRTGSILDAVRKEGVGSGASRGTNASHEWGKPETAGTALTFSSDPEKRAEEIAEFAKLMFETEDPLARMQQFVALTAALKSGEDIKVVLNSTMDGFDWRSRGREMSVLMSLWAGKDAEAALAWTKEIKDERTGMYAAGSALAVWTKSNPEGAVAWARANGPTDPKDEGGNWHMASVIGALAKTDLDRASLLAQEEKRSEARGRMMDRLLDQYQEQRGDDAARTWAASLAEGPFREGALRRVMERTMGDDPAKSAAWVATLPEGNGKPGAMSTLIERWAGKDPNAAGAWLNNFPASPETDEPRSTFARQILERDPEAALSWAGTVSNPEERTRLTYDLARDWSRRDPDGALQWATTAQGIDPKVRDRLVRRIQERKEG